MSESQGDARPLLLIDVDGPLNPYRARWARRHGYASHRMWPSVWSARHAEGSRALRRGLRVRLRAADGPRLLALPYTPVWATTWAHEANEMIAPALGIEEPLPVIDWPRLFEIAATRTRSTPSSGRTQRTQETHARPANGSLVSGPLLSDLVTPRPWRTRRKIRHRL
ncbi:hypothetical protein [Streptomyces sp. AM 3-1-1]|uniref:hypothetical protein n=1 Tax=Streptomyces sp. AM 3-1-1 TaxID=3028711 RepID=UPI0023B914FC|nr:hypothetical protein [Streptomyces sp. AM 3-1-1]WEH30591.1 hypothetical protein P0D76_26505 [Streptomyces sp. AM 3-1-1]